jgi:hypothetical protein
MPEEAAFDALGKETWSEGWSIILQPGRSPAFPVAAAILICKMSVESARHKSSLLSFPGKYDISL